MRFVTTALRAVPSRGRDRFRAPLRKLRMAAPVAALVIALVTPGSAGAASRTAAFAPIDPGVRAAGMGGAYSALGGEPTALYWNPAALYYQTERSLEASYSDLYGLGLVKRTQITFGSKAVYEVPRFTANRVEVRKDRRTGPGYALGIQSLFVDIDDQGYSELSFGGGAAWGYGERVVVGVSLRGLYVSSDLDGVSANGYAVGFGASYRYSQHERLAIAVPHLMTRLFWKFDTTERLPLGVNLGWTRSFGDHFVTTAEAEWRESETGPYRIAAGSEWWVFPERLAVRAGFRHLSGGYENLNRPTFGLGIRFNRMRLDYAFRLENDVLGDTHRLGLLVGF